MVRIGSTLDRPPHSVPNAFRSILALRYYSLEQHDQNEKMGLLHALDASHLAVPIRRLWSHSIGAKTVDFVSIVCPKTTLAYCDWRCRRL